MGIIIQESERWMLHMFNDAVLDCWLQLMIVCSIRSAFNQSDHPPDPIFFSAIFSADQKILNYVKNSSQKSNLQRESNPLILSINRQFIIHLRRCLYQGSFTPSTTTGGQLVLLHMLINFIRRQPVVTQINDQHHHCPVVLRLLAEKVRH